MPPLIKIVPPIWMFCFLILAIGFHFGVPASRAFDISYPIVGVILLVIGFVPGLLASAQFKKEENEILPSSETNRVLITSGLYRYSRNPMYLGMILVLLGAAFIGGSLPFFLAALAQFLLLNFVFIPFEETKLARIFGDAYLDYMRQVRRWI